MKRALRGRHSAEQDHVLRRRQDRRANCALAVDAGILCVNVEIRARTRTALVDRRRARAAPRDISIRVNPDVDAKTHAKIATGKSENKFGIPISRAREVYAMRAKLPGIQVAGVDMHIGSQITELSPFADAFALLSDFVRDVARRRPRDLACRSRRRARHSLSRRRRQCRRRPRLTRRWSSTRRTDLGCKLIFEPGRLIVGNAGILVTRVLYVKRGEAKTFVIVDAAMNDLIRPTLYEAHHDILPVRRAGRRARRDLAPMWSGRSARPAIISRSTATCRNRSPATCWRS